MSIDLLIAVPFCCRFSFAFLFDTICCPFVDELPPGVCRPFESLIFAGCNDEPVVVVPQTIRNCFTHRLCTRTF